MSRVNLTLIQKDAMGSTLTSGSVNLKSYAFKAHRVLRRYGLDVTGIIIDSIHATDAELAKGFRINVKSISPSLRQQLEKELRPLGCHPFKVEKHMANVFDISF